MKIHTTSLYFNGKSHGCCESIHDTISETRVGEGGGVVERMQFPFKNSAQQKPLKLKNVQAEP